MTELFEKCLLSKTILAQIETKDRVKVFKLYLLNQKQMQSTIHKSMLKQLLISESEGLNSDFVQEILTELNLKVAKLAKIQNNSERDENFKELDLELTVENILSL